MKRRTRRRVAFRGRRQNRFGMFLVSAVVVMLLLVISVHTKAEAAGIYVDRGRAGCQDC